MRPLRPLRTRPWGIDSPCIARWEHAGVEWREAWLRAHPPAGVRRPSRRRTKAAPRPEWEGLAAEAAREIGEPEEPVEDELDEAVRLLRDAPEADVLDAAARLYAEGVPVAHLMYGIHRLGHRAPGGWLWTPETLQRELERRRRAAA